MARLIYLPLLLATIPRLPLVSTKVRELILHREGTITLLQTCSHQWIITQDCRAQTWIWKLKCCTDLENKVIMKVIVDSQNWNKQTIRLQAKNGYLEQCHNGSEIYLSTDKKVVWKKGYANFRCRESTVGCINFQHRDKIHISMLPADNKGVNITFKNTTQQYSISNSTCNDTGLHFYKHPKSWIDALTYCESKNSSLVHIISDIVQDDVEYLLENKTDLQEGAWIGLERSIFGCNLHWKWTSGPYVADAHWNSSLPVDPMNHHCGKIIRVSEYNYKWLDADCFEELPFICQDDTDGTDAT